MPALLDLSLEIREMIVLQLDMEEMLSLGSSCTLLARVGGQVRVWRVLLARTELEEGRSLGCAGQGRGNSKYILSISPLRYSRS